MLKISRTIIMTALTAVLIVGGLAFTARHASADSKTDICNGVGLATGSAGSCDTGTGDAGLGSIIKQVVSILSIIVGVVAVIMIIVGAFKYITSGGDANNLTGAKNTIVYALIGLVIAALAQILIHFVLTQATKAIPATTPATCPNGQPPTGTPPAC